jgi:hypothetical protein
MVVYEIHDMDILMIMMCEEGSKSSIFSRIGVFYG